jgi:hypothetical protein
MPLLSSLLEILLYCYEYKYGYDVTHSGLVLFPVDYDVNDKASTSIINTEKYTKSQMTVMTSEERIVYTKSELDAIRKAYTLLQDTDFCRKNKRETALSEKEISRRHLAITVIVSKCRPDEAASKYLEWLRGLSAWGIEEFNEEQLINPPKRSDSYLQFYKVAGKDIHGTRIFWIDGEKRVPNDLEEEKMAVYADLRYHMAVHACANTARNGLTLVIDGSNKSNEKTGNEKRLQKSHNGYPLRPQHIFIVGASKVVRVSINTVLKLTTIVSKAKILKRIKFVTLDQIVDTKNGGTIPSESLPCHLNGRSSLGHLMANNNVSKGKKEDQKISIDEDNRLTTVDWVNQRIAQIPMPDI